MVEEVTLCTLSTMATIRVSEDNHKELNRVGGRLRQESFLEEGNIDYLSRHAGLAWLLELLGSLEAMRCLSTYM